MAEHPPYCWYCANGYREVFGNVKCNRDGELYTKNWSCLYFKECPIKKDAPENKIGI